MLFWKTETKTIRQMKKDKYLLKNNTENTLLKTFNDFQTLFSTSCINLKGSLKISVKYSEVDKPYKKVQKVKT